MKRNLSGWGYPYREQNSLLLYLADTCACALITWCLQNHTIPGCPKDSFVICVSNVLEKWKDFCQTKVKQAHAEMVCRFHILFSVKHYRLRIAIVKWLLINNTCAHLTCALNGKMAYIYIYIYIYIRWS